MATHFECVGFPLARDEASEERLPAILRGIFDGGRPLPGPEGFHAAEWRSPGGAAAYAAVTVDPETGAPALRCLTPSFLGPGRVRFRCFRTIPDPECPFCDYLHGEALPGDGGPGVPLFAEIKDPAFSRDRDLRGAEVVLQVSLLAQHLHAYAGEEEFRARRPDPIEPGAFVPVGLLRQPHRALARVAARVIEARRLENPLTGLPFHHARVGSAAGEMDLLAAAADLPGDLRPGGIVLAEASLVARFPEGLPGAGAGAGAEG
jgi:hypothetical protein